MAKVLVLSADRYDFEDEKGKKIKGLTMFFVNEYREDAESSRGHKPSRVTIPETLEPGVMAANVSYPAVCDIEFGTRPGSDGKLSAFVSSFRYLAHVPLEKIFSAIQPQR